MWLVRMVIISGSTGLKWRMLMPTRVEGMAQMGWRITEISMFLKVEDFTVYDKVFWRFHVRGSCIIGQICSAESKDIRVPGKTVSGAVPHREVHIVIGSFLSSHSHNSLHLVHSERGKVNILFFVLLKGLVCLVSEELGILNVIEEYGAVFSIGQCRRDRTCGAIKVIHSKILRFIQTCGSYYLTLSNHYIRWTSGNSWLTVIPLFPGSGRTVRFFHI